MDSIGVVSKTLDFPLFMWMQAECFDCQNWSRECPIWHLSTSLQQPIFEQFDITSMINPRDLVQQFELPTSRLQSNLIEIFLVFSWIVRPLFVVFYTKMAADVQIECNKPQGEHDAMFIQYVPDIIKEDSWLSMEWLIDPYSMKLRMAGGSLQSSYSHCLWWRYDIC